MTLCLQCCVHAYSGTTCTTSCHMYTVHTDKQWDVWDVLASFVQLPRSGWTSWVSLEQSIDHLNLTLRQSLCPQIQSHLHGRQHRRVCLNLQTLLVWWDNCSIWSVWDKFLHSPLHWSLSNKSELFLNHPPWFLHEALSVKLPLWSILLPLDHKPHPLRSQHLAQHNRKLL